jgi:dephospho-CoA kinase
VARPLTIGLTGGIAAGKSEALAALGRLGAATISSDAVVHELLGDPEVAEALVERWGEGVAADGAIDRRKVGEVVFADPAELTWLERFLHPRVGERIAAWLGTLPEGTEVAAIEVPLLFEAAMEDAFDLTVAVVADEQLRAERAGLRDHTLLDERAARQLSQAEKADRADHTVHNDGTLEELERKLAEIVAEALEG